MTQLDLSILDWIQQHLRCGFLDVFMPIVTRFGDGGIFWIALSLTLLILPKTRKFGLAMGLALLADVLLCNGLIKPLVARPRPWVLRSEMERLILVKLPGGGSFPSGHTAASFAAATALLFKRSKWGWAALALAALVGLSRLYLYVHYPTDVLAGAILGTGCGALGAFLSDLMGKFYRKCKK